MCFFDPDIESQPAVLLLVYFRKVNSPAAFFHLLTYQLPHMSHLLRTICSRTPTNKPSDRSLSHFSPFAFSSKCELAPHVLRLLGLNQNRFRALSKSQWAGYRLISASVVRWIASPIGGQTIPKSSGLLEGEYRELPDRLACTIVMSDEIRRSALLPATSF